MNLVSLILISMLAFTPYVWNAVKLSDCDFETPYRCEFIHGIGVVMPPTVYVTVWFGVDSTD